MKTLVKPATPIMLVLGGGEVVHPGRPSVVTVDSFINSRIASGTLLLVASGIPDEATDEQFVGFLRASKVKGVVDVDLAVESFLSSFPAVEVVGTEAKTDETKAEELARAVAEAEEANKASGKKTYGKK